MSIDSIVHLYKRVLIVSILLLWAYPMFAQQHSIEIKVIDAENGNSIEFATVQWKGLNDPSYKNGTTTNRKGVARLNIHAHQKLVLRVSYVGYQTITDTITANEKRHTLKLRPESTELANVVVFGKTKAQVQRVARSGFSDKCKGIARSFRFFRNHLEQDHWFEGRADRWIGKQFEDYRSRIGRKPHSDSLGWYSDEYVGWSLFA